MRHICLASWAFVTACCGQAQALSPVMCPETPVFFAAGSAQPLARLQERGRLDDVQQGLVDGVRAFLKEGRVLQVIGRAAVNDGVEARGLAEHRAIAIGIWLRQHGLLSGTTRFFAQVENDIPGARGYLPVSGIVGFRAGCPDADPGRMPDYASFLAYAERIEYDP